MNITHQPAFWLALSLDLAALAMLVHAVLECA